MITKNKNFILNTMQDINEEALSSFGIKLSKEKNMRIRLVIAKSIINNPEFWEEYWTMVKDGIEEINKVDAKLTATFRGKRIEI